MYSINRVQGHYRVNYDHMHHGMGVHHSLVMRFYIRQSGEWWVIPYISETTETSELNVGGYNLL